MALALDHELMTGYSEGDSRWWRHAFAWIHRQSSRKEDLWTADQRWWVYGVPTRS